MDIDLHTITVRELYDGYIDDDEEGVRGYHGLLNIRPKYQRNYVYKEKERNAVMHTLMQGFPLNIMYWAINEDGTYEVLDGQQRTISICSFVNNDYSINEHYFHGLPADKQEAILNYKLTIYWCKGKESEKLDWFRVVNIAGLKLSEQELRNIAYTGTWLSDAKKHFSKLNCVADQLGGDYLNGDPDRQAYLETVLDWISDGKIEKYMADHQHDEDADELWLYFQKVIKWVEMLFPQYDTAMKGLPWGTLYNDHHEDSDLKPQKLAKRIAELKDDDDVQSMKGIYLYLLTGEEKHLNLRAFKPKEKAKKYKEQKGVCPICHKKYKESEMEGDHIIPWHDGGKTEYSNLQMLCKHCNRTKSGK